MSDVWDTRNKKEGKGLSEPEKPRFKELKDPYKKGPAFTIPFKLTLAFTSLLLIGLGLMIYFLSRSFFHRENSARVQEHILALSESMGSQLEIKIDAIREKAYFIYSLALAGDQQDYAQRIFNSNANFIFLSIASDQEKERVKPALSFYNSKYMALNKIKKETLNKNYTNHKQYMQKARQNIFSLFNASLGQVPLLGLSFPLDSDRVAMLYIYPETIFKIFEAHSSVSAYMVDVRGDIVAHRDPETYLKSSKLKSEPIVRQMLRSQTLSGQLRYFGRDNKAYLASFRKLSLANVGLLVYLEEDRVFSSAHELREYNIVVSLIILLFALLFIYHFAKTLSVPILTLGRAVKEVEQGHYDLKIKPAFRDELGSLTKSFLDMSKVLKEREVEKKLLLPSANKKVSETDLEGLKICGEKNMPLFLL